MCVTNERNSIEPTVLERVIKSAINGINRNVREVTGYDEVDEKRARFRC